MPFNAMQSAPPAPSTDLGRLRILARNAGVRMSPLQFGGISVGTAWHEYTPPSEKKESFELLDDFVAAGGVSIDTASGYSDEQSEQWIGEWMTARGNRDRLVISTKYTTDFRSYEIGKNEAANLCGNARKSMHVSIKASLRKLQTDYIDILYIHWWDWTCSIAEIMDALDAFVKQGKVLYLGASNLPAWIVSACNEYASARSQAQFVVYQGQWNIMDRDLELEILPVCRMYGMAVVPWGALGSGRLKSKEQLQAMIATKQLAEDDITVKASRALHNIAQSHGIDSFAPVALAWLFAKYPRTFPIVGVKTPTQLADNIRSLSILLSPAEIQQIDGLCPLPLRYPYGMCGMDPNAQGIHGGNNALQLGTIDWLREDAQYVRRKDQSGSS